MEKQATDQMLTGSNRATFGGRLEIAVGKTHWPSAHRTVSACHENRH
jgi:hypothetical protein